MKKFTLIFALLTTLLITVQAGDPCKFIPRQSPSILRLNINRLLSDEELKKSLDDNKELKDSIDFFEALLKKSGNKDLKLSDVFPGQMWFAQTGSSPQDYSGYLQTSLTEDEFTELLKNAGQSIRTTTAAGKNIYLISAEDDDIAVVYISSKVIMLTKMNKQLPLQITVSLQGGGNPLLENLDHQSLLAGAVDIAAVKGKKRPDIKFARAKLDMDKKLNLSAQILLYCKDSKEAMKTAMKIQFAVPGAIAMFFSQDEALVAALTNGLQVIPQEDMVSIDYRISHADLKKITKYFSENNEKAESSETKGVGPQPKNEQ